MGIVRLVSVLAAALGLGVAASASAYAQDDMCVGLQARLSVLDNGPENFWDDQSGEIRKAIARQRRELDRLNAQSARAGCSASGLFPRRPAAKCGALTASINRARANLQRLDAESGQFAVDPYAADRERAEIRRALAANRCGDEYAETAAQRRSRGFFTSLFGRQYPDAPLEPRGYYRVDEFGFGTFRTLCVRTCDGSFFPISFSTVEEKFAADEQSCQAMCPGVDVRLYVHRNPGGDADSMMSLAGEPYSALPAAFRFRREYDAACVCRAATAAVGGETGANKTPPLPALPRDAAVPIIATPDPRPGGAEDPETLANRAGELVPGTAEPGEPAASVAGLGPDGKPVRIVGPTYYIAQ